MKYNCDIVRDLLPMYIDRMCSESSRHMVEEHLEECAECKKLALQAQDNSIEEKLTDEKKEVLYNHRKTVNKKTFAIGMATAGILTIPVIVCLICNLVTQHALDWFFIVLTAMLLTASILVVPMVVGSKRLTWTIVSSTVSLLLLLLSCCVYTRGDWFWVASTACILGLSVVFAPFVIKDIPMGMKLKKYKADITLAWDSLWLYLLLIACGIYIKADFVYWQDSMAIATYMLLIVWVWFIIIKYVRKNNWTKAGSLTVISGLWLGLANDILNFFAASQSTSSLRNLDLKAGFSTTDPEIMNANMMFMIMVIMVGTGLICLCIGLGKGKKNH